MLIYVYSILNSFAYFSTEPTITTTDSNFTKLFPGEDIIISLDYFGIPPPTISWSRDGIPLMNNIAGITLMTTVNTSILDVNDNGGQSGGQYVVNASNSAASVQAQFTIECKQLGTL